MSYKTETYQRVGNGKMGASIKDLASSCDLTINHYSATGWVLKEITITVFGHVDDFVRFERLLPASVQS